MDTFYERALRYTEELNPPLSGLMREIRRVGNKRGVPIVDDEMGRFLSMICSLYRPKAILEIGCGISYSTHWMLAGCGECRITALDVNRERLAQCAEYLKRSNNADRVELLDKWADEFFRGNSKRFDMIFLDSTKREYVDLMESCHKALRPEGILVADNIFFNGKVLGLSEGEAKRYKIGTDLLKRFNEEIARFPGFACTFLPFSDGVLVAQRIN